MQILSPAAIDNVAFHLYPGVRLETISFLAPIRIAAFMLRRLSIRQRTSDCSRQLVRKKRFTAVTASRCAIRRAMFKELASRAFEFRAEVPASLKTARQIRKPSRRTASHAMSKPAAASSTIPRSNLLKRRNLRHLRIIA